jgi:hypothetical protein
MLGREQVLPSLLAAIVAVMAGVLVGTGIAGRSGAAIETVVDAAARPAAVRPAVAAAPDRPVKREVVVHRHRAPRPARAPAGRPVTAASSPVAAGPRPHPRPHHARTASHHQIGRGHARRHGHGHAHGHGHGHEHGKHGRHRGRE